MLLEQLCLAKIVRSSPYYDCKKLILFQYEFSYNRSQARTLLWHHMTLVIMACACFFYSIRHFMQKMHELMPIPILHIMFGALIGRAQPNKGFSNRDITILSMNKTQKYLRYWVQIYCGCSASITFYEWNSISVIWPPQARLLRLFFGPNFPPLWHTFRAERWRFRVGCCLWGRLKFLACWHRPVTWYGPIRRNPMALDRMNEAAIWPGHFSR